MTAAAWAAIASAFLTLNCNSVQISAATIGVLLGELQTLQGLQSPVGGGGAVVLTDSVDLADSGNSHWRPGKIS